MLEPSILQAKQPQPSQPVLTGELSQPSDHLCGLLWTRSNWPMSVLIWMQHSRWGLMREEYRDRITLTCWPCFFLHIPENKLLSGLQVPVASSCPIFYLPVSPSPSLQRCSQDIHHPVCIDIGDCLYSGAGLCLFPQAYHILVVSSLK